MADMPVIARRLIGEQDSEGSAQQRAPVPGCRHVLLPRTACACASIAYGVSWRLGYRSPSIAHGTSMLVPWSTMSGAVHPVSEISGLHMPSES
jgi:hypothetical protein